jgi:hypothetical protein
VFPEARLHSFGVVQRLRELVQSVPDLDPHAPVTLDDECQRQCRFWSRITGAANIRDLRDPAGPPCATVITDASPTGWGAVLLRPGQRRLHRFGLWTRAERTLWHSNTKELQGMVNGVAVFDSPIRAAIEQERDRIQRKAPRLRLKQVPVVRTRSDNTMVVSYLRRWGGRFAAHTRRLIPLARRMRRWGPHVWLKDHIPGVSNGWADSESRRHPALLDWALSDSSWTRIVSAFGEPLFDLFASPATARTWLYASMIRAPRAHLDDAFSAQWTAQGLAITSYVRPGTRPLLYAYPPFCQVGRALAHARRSGARLIMVVPHEPARYWWPLIMAAAVGGLVPLPSFDEGGYCAPPGFCGRVRARLVAVLLDYGRGPSHL